jgi:hypothetical protein
MHPDLLKEIIKSCQERTAQRHLHPEPFIHYEDLETAINQQSEDSFRAERQLETLHLVLTSTVAERDNRTKWADKLASAIADYLAIDIGEHSTRNNPWLNAIEALQQHALTARPKP